jgi:hypothetical protein
MLEHLPPNIKKIRLKEKKSIVRDDNDICWVLPYGSTLALAIAFQVRGLANIVQPVTSCGLLATFWHYQRSDLKSGYQLDITTILVGGRGADQGQ